MIKLLIKQGPFYISSFTALFLALDQTGWLDKMFPPDAELIALPLLAEASPAAEELEWGVRATFTDSLDFYPEPAPFFEQPLFLITAFVIGGLLLGYSAKKVWEFVFD